MQLRCVFMSDFVIVMDKPPLKSGPRESNTQSYYSSSTLEKFRRENFREVSVVLLRKFCTVRYDIIYIDV